AGVQVPGPGALAVRADFHVERAQGDNGVAPAVRALLSGHGSLRSAHRSTRLVDRQLTFWPGLVVWGGGHATRLMVTGFGQSWRGWGSGRAPTTSGASTAQVSQTQCAAKIQPGSLVTASSPGDVLAWRRPRRCERAGPSRD